MEVLFILGCLVSLASTDQQRQSGHAIGMVDDAVGAWSRPANESQRKEGDSNDKLSPGDLLYNGDRVFTAYSTSSSISVVLFGTGKIWEKTCSKDAPCEGAYYPPTPALTRSGLWTFLTSFQSSGRRFPSVFAAARGFERVKPQHALIEASGKTVEFKPVFHDLRPGAYIVGLSPVHRASSDAKPRQVYAVQWDGSTATVNGVAPGFYSATITNGAGEMFDSTAAVLVLGARFPKAQATWREAQREVASWQGARPSTVDTFLIRILDTLHSQHIER